jgi:hypothetical protein
MTRVLATLHRWISIVLCLMFALWFTSGIVMIYVPFPSLPDSERIARAAVIDVSKVNSLTAALNATGVKSANRLRLLQYQQRPILIAQGDNNIVAASFADSSDAVKPLTKADAITIAQGFSNAPVASVSAPFLYDQWVVHDRFDPFRPFFRVEMADSIGTHLYVSAKSTEILQKTNRSQRAWNYLGAVVHWIYPTVIRKDWVLWDQIVWWVSLVCLIGVLTGLILGIQHWQVAKQRGLRGLASPFSGWLAWHHKIGLISGVIVLLWMFSGWLSMDHGRLFSSPNPTAQQTADMRGVALSEALAAIQLEDLYKTDGAQEIEITALNKQTLVVAKNGEESKLIPIGLGQISDRRTLISSVELAISQAWPDNAVSDSYLVPANDTYGNLREGSLGAETLRLILDDADETWVHVDLTTGDLISVMDNSRRIYRWLFNGIHSLDFPGLANHRFTWSLLMLILMSTGLIFCITGIVLAYKKITQMVSR